VPENEKKKKRKVYLRIAYTAVFTVL